ncbi:MAG: HrgA protein [Thermoplasmata archaeon]|nr:HrgA protein [Thermoplasmata archaeon]
MSLTGLQLSEKILRETKIPMTPGAMWEYALKKGYDKDTSIRGKTPWKTLQAQIYTQIQSNEGSIFVKVSPGVFGLRCFDYSIAEEPVVKTKTSDNASERELHPLLVSYVNSDPHFLGHTMTIQHENSVKKGKNAEKWMHPDLVSVHLPFDDLDQNTISLAKNAGIETITIFSFEMKKDVTGANVREYYFQAVSNSSWANEGYLVSPKFSDEALKQLSKLNASFGIGVIKLNLDDIHQSEILLPSRENDLDVTMIDELVRINKDFSTFVSIINKSMDAKGLFGENKFDKVLSDEELEQHIEKTKIRKLAI